MSVPYPPFHIHTGGAGADRDGDPDKPAHGSHTTNGPESRLRSEHRVKSRSLLAALCIGGNVKLNRLQDLIGGSAMPNYAAQCKAMVI